MGINTRGTSSSNKTFLNIYQGNIVLEYDTQDALTSKLDSLGLEYAEDISETNRMGHVCERLRTKGKNEGKSVFYYILSDISGMLTNIKSTVNDFGEFVELEFTDVDETFSVSLGDVYSRICKDFIRRAGNIDLSKELTFGVWNITVEEADNGKAKSGVKMYQDDTKLEYAIGYDEMPEPTTKKKGSKTIWNFDEQEEFLYNALMEFKNDNFLDESVSESLPQKDTATKKAVARKPREEVKASDATDDLPF
jgi:hypothetical protein